MICLLALIAFGILGIFSATHRRVAREAFDCVFRKVTLRKCRTSLDQKLKSQIIGTLLKKNQRLARFTYKNFEAISWVFTVLFFVSIFYTAVGGYNYLIFGNCNGENSNEMCVYNGIESAFSVGCESPLCQNKDCKCKNESSCVEREGDICQEECLTTGK